MYKLDTLICIYNLPDPGIQPAFPALQADSLPSEPPGKPYIRACHAQICLCIHIHMFPSFQAHGPHRLRLAQHAQKRAPASPSLKTPCAPSREQAITHHVIAFSLTPHPPQQQPLISANCRAATQPCKREQSQGPSRAVILWNKDSPALDPIV